MIKNILIHHKDFERWFIDEGEELYFPIILNPFNKEAYFFLKDLEETFYPNNSEEKLLLFLNNPLGMLNIVDIKGKQDGLRSSAVYFITQLSFKMTNNKESLFVLIKKEPHLKKRLNYLFEKHNIKTGNIWVGLNKNYLKNGKQRKPIDSKLRHECFKRDGYKCVECGATNKEKILRADHILPVSQGGTDELSNLQTLCEDCNFAKSNKYWKGERWKRKK